MAYVLVLVLLAGVVWIVTQPLRRAATVDGGADGNAEERQLAAMRRIDLEAARDAKYREIRDAELDHQTGKLSDEDHAAIDSTLRAEAVALLRELDELEQHEQRHEQPDAADSAGE